MAKKKQSDAADAPNPLGWMVTFSDLITLLLTFFVLLISMSSMDVRSVKQAFGTIFTGGAGVLAYPKEGKLGDISRILEQLDRVSRTSTPDAEYLKNLIFDFKDVEFQKLMNLVDRDITVKKDERGLVIQLADYILFSEGGAVLQPEYLPILSRIANVLRQTRQPISIEGHTDASVLEGGKSAWAWELSIERSIAVLKYFTEEERLLQERFRVAGYGSSKPIAPNDTPKNRAKNRRIEIILYQETRG